MIHFPAYSLANMFIHKYIRRYIKHVNVAPELENRDIEVRPVTLLQLTAIFLVSVVTALTYYHTYDL